MGFGGAGSQFSKLARVSLAFFAAYWVSLELSISLRYTKLEIKEVNRCFRVRLSMDHRIWFIVAYVFLLGTH